MVFERLCPHPRWLNQRGSLSPACPEPAQNAKSQEGCVSDGVSARGATHPRWRSIRDIYCLRIQSVAWVSKPSFKNLFHSAVVGAQGAWKASKKGPFLFTSLWRGHWWTHGHHFWRTGVLWDLRRPPAAWTLSVLITGAHSGLQGVHKPPRTVCRTVQVCKGNFWKQSKAATTAKLPTLDSPRDAWPRKDTQCNQ